MISDLIFGDFPEQYTAYDKAKIVLLPVPYDETSTWIKGADRGPEAILKASPNLEFYDIETETEVYKKGIYTAPPVLEKSSPEKMVEAVKEKAASYIADNKFVVTLGGEHSISYGTIAAHAEQYANMSVLQFDAHSDLRDQYHGSKYNHACVMARTKEICPIVQVGIRSMDASELKNMNKTHVFFAERIYAKTDWHKQVLEQLTDTVYITIDLDVFDISIMPATGTPEPGGLLWYDVLPLLKLVSEKKKIVGFDIVELCPNEYSRPSDFMAAKLIYKLLTYIHNN